MTIKKYHTKNLNKPIVISPPMDKGASTPLIVTCLEAEIAPLTIVLIHSPIRKYFHARKNLFIHLCHNKQHWKLCLKLSNLRNI